MSYAHALGQTASPNLDAWRADIAVASQAGIPVLALKAIRSNESGSHAGVIRFEPRIFNALTSNRYQSQFPSDTGSSGTGTAPPSAFTRAYQLDPHKAVDATSWGLYQELMRDVPQMWATAGNDPARFIQMFNANPEEISNQLLAGWFHNRTPARAAARALNWPLLAQRYNGCCPHGLTGCTACDTYAGRLRTANARWAPEWAQVRTMLPASLVSVAESGAGIIADNPYTFLTLGVATVAVAGVATYYFTTRGRRVKPNRRRSSRRLAA